MITYLTFCLNTSFSNDMAIEFGKENLMTFYSSALVIFALILCFLNSGILLTIKHKYKIWATIAIWVTSIILFILAEKYQIFMLSMVASILVGLATNLGQLTTIGFMKCFPPIIVSGLSSGTGMGGVLGSVVYVVFKHYNISITTTLLSMLLFYPLYAFSFYLVTRLQLKRQTMASNANNNETADDSQINHIEMNQEIAEQPDPESPNEMDEATAQALLEEQESKINERLSWESFKFIYSKVGRLLLSFFFIYFLNYLSITSFASLIRSKYKKMYTEDDMPTMVYLLFEMLQLMFCIGYFMGKSSLDFFQIKRIWAISTWMIVVTITFCGQIFIEMALPVWIPITNMFFVGLVAGFGWVNICHQILEHPEIGKKHRELALNFNMMFSYFGIILSSFLGFLFLYLWNG